MNRTTYYFAPSVRQGLSAAITGTATGRRVRKGVRVELTANQIDSTDLTAATKERPVELYGPGDILGFRPVAVVRTDPKRNVDDFEPNYFPVVEFADPDFPWRYTADVDVEGKLTPWLTLIVLVQKVAGSEASAEFTEGKTRRGLPRWITVDYPNGPLPDLSQSWRWAHVQVVGGETDVDLAEVVASGGAALSRLVCARRLQPGTRYSAFVVPTFEVGRLAGLGLDPPDELTALDLTGATNTGSTLDLPYYYRWDFGTGMRGDFERLVRLLEPRKDTGGLGTRTMDCSAPGYGVAGVKIATEDGGEDTNLGLEGAIRPFLDEQHPVLTQWGWDAMENPPTGNSEGDGGAFRREVAELLHTDQEDITRKDYDDFAPPANAAGFTNIEGHKGDIVTWLTISWNTDVPMSSQVRFARDGEELAHPVGDDAVVTEHTYTLRGLEPGSVYRFALQGEEEDGHLHETGEGTFTVPALPSVVPPIYGRWHQGYLPDPLDDLQILQDDGWLWELNLDPRHRAAAGFGAEVVRQQQEDLMAVAWDQLADVEAANTLLRRSQLARESSIRTWKRIGALGEDALMAVSQPVHRRLLATDTGPNSRSIAVLMGEVTPIPAATLSPAFRRITRPRGALRRRQGKLWMRNMVRELAAGTLRAAESDPKPAGMIEMGAVTGTLAAEVGAVEPPSVEEALGKGSIQQKIRDGLQTGFVEVIPEIDREQVRESLTEGMAWLQKIEEPLEEPAPPPEYIPEVADDILGKLDPRKTIEKRVWARLESPIADELRQRGDPLDDIMWAPTFPQPMYEPLRDIGQDLILPGVDKVPQNTVLLLTTNRRFVESYMMGLNHEFASELLWRGYPTDQRGSYFRQFWDVRERVPAVGEDSEENQERFLDIGLVHAWTEQLGKNRVEGAADERMILIVRGDLLKKYPNTVIYAIDRVPRDVPCAESSSDGGEPEPGDDSNEEEFTVPALREYLRCHDAPNPEAAQEAIDEFLRTEAGQPKHAPVYPIFKGELPPDITFLGFNFDREDARDMYFVIEERVSETRFGLDMPGSTERPQFLGLGHLAWDHFVPAGGDLDGGWHLDSSYPSLTAADSQGDRDWLDEVTDSWAEDEEPTSALIAQATMQQPVRVAIDSETLLRELTSGDQSGG